MTYSTVSPNLNSNTEIYLGVIDEPGENYEINFIFRGHNYRSQYKALFRFTNREGYTNYGTYSDRSPLITWYVLFYNTHYFLVLTFISRLDRKSLVYVKNQ